MLGSLAKNPPFLIVPQVFLVQLYVPDKVGDYGKICTFHDVSVSPTYVTTQKLLASASDALVVYY